MDMPTETVLKIKCPGCGAMNRIPAAKKGQTARCGQCKQTLPAPPKTEKTGRFYNFRCSQCRAKNRIPAEKLNSAARCGKCGHRLDTTELTRPNPLPICDADFESNVLKSPLPVLLYCYSNRCPNCAAVNPIIDQLAAETRRRVRVGKLNIDLCPQTASRLDVMAVPFLFIYDKGRIQESLPGGVNKHELMLKMAHYL